VQRELLDKQLEHEKLPVPQEYMAFQTLHKKLSRLVTEQPDNFANRAFERAMIDTSKLADIQSLLKPD